MSIQFSSSSRKRELLARSRLAALSDNRDALLIGSATAFIVFVGALALGFQIEASTRFLLNSIAPTSRYLASVCLLSGAVIVTLMLMLVSAKMALVGRIDNPTLRRIRLLTVFCSIMVAVSLVLLLVPGIFFDTLPKVIFYGIVAYSAILGGLLIASIVLACLTLARLNPQSDRVIGVPYLSEDDEEYGKYSGL